MREGAGCEGAGTVRGGAGTVPGVGGTEPSTSTEHDEEPPEELCCPITYALYRDPVRLRAAADGRVFERDAIVSFWRRRPLADFLGGPQLSSALMDPAPDVQRKVAAWLGARPSLIPPGPESSDGSRDAQMALLPIPSTQFALDALAAEIEDLAATRAAAVAAATGDEAAFATLLQLSATQVWLVGCAPKGRHKRHLGCYVRRADLPLMAGRFVYQQAGTDNLGARQPWLWHANNGFWHAGERRQVSLAFPPSPTPPFPPYATPHSPYMSPTSLQASWGGDRLADRF